VSWTRRRLLGSAAALALLPFAGSCRGERRAAGPRAPAPRKASRSPVAILAQDRYGDELADAVLRGMSLCALEARGARVVVKPNLVEFDPQGAVNTHPLLVGATVEALRRLGAAEIVVAEGPGHRRDTEYLLRASGLGDVLRELRVPYVDLNLDRVRRVPLRSSYTGFGELWLPRTVLDADLLVSLPKLKTHHWAGVTLSMKNLFGIVPGAVYGWPKNPLHWQGIQRSIVDLNACLPCRRFAVVDGIVGMEGNGPIQGRARPAGVVVLGEDPVAVDASAARLMGIEPLRVPHLREAGRFLGHAEAGWIEQRGERLEEHVQDFALLDAFALLKEPLG
jgi:uncharacterized protein (DUF362 family)